jgi:ArsR family transcriptional regulator
VIDPDLRKKADLLKVLGNPTRLAILEELRAGVKCVSDIEDLLEIRQANVSQHLVILKREGLVDFHEDGNLRCYYLRKPGLVTALVRFLSEDYPLKTRSAISVRREGKSRREKCTDESN